MTLQEVVDQLILRCGNKKNHETLLTAEVSSAITELEEEIFHPWFLLSGRRNVATVIGDDRVPLPVDFIAEYEEGALWVKQDGQLEPLSKVTLDEIQEELEVVGTPAYYTITGDYIRLYPTPDAEYELQMLYYRKSGTVNDNNVWLKYASNYVIGTVMLNYGSSVRDKNLVRLGESRKQKAYMALLARHTEHQIANRDLVKGD